MIDPIITAARRGDRVDPTGWFYGMLGLRKNSNDGAKGGAQRDGHHRRAAITCLHRNNRVLKSQSGLLDCCYGYPIQENMRIPRAGVLRAQ